VKQHGSPSANIAARVIDTLWDHRAWLRTFLPGGSLRLSATGACYCYYPVIKEVCAFPRAIASHFGGRPFAVILPGMDSLHATIEEFAAEGYTHVQCYARDVAPSGLGRSATFNRPWQRTFVRRTWNGIRRP